MAPPALDTYRRPLRNLRLSVTDRCNLRCAYCMPEEDYGWLPGDELLSFEELSSVVDRFIAVGVRRIRLTGGEPLLRRDLPELVAMLARKPLEDLALTTNGVRLAEHARALRAAGLRRVTVSLDTLRPDRFRALTRRDRLGDVLAGIEAARGAGFPGPLKLDAVVLRGTNDDELVPLLDFARGNGAELRFIEYMDVGGATRWRLQDVLSREEIAAQIAEALGPLRPLPRETPDAPAELFATARGERFGIIASTTAPFCSACDRARLTADGHFFTCLYAKEGLDLKGPLRSGAPPERLEELLYRTWSGRADRGAEARLALQAGRSRLAGPEDLRLTPHLEMHTRGG